MFVPSSYSQILADFTSQSKSKSHLDHVPSFPLPRWNAYQVVLKCDSEKVKKTQGGTTNGNRPQTWEQHGTFQLESEHCKIGEEILFPIVPFHLRVALGIWRMCPIGALNTRTALDVGPDGL